MCPSSFKDVLSGACWVRENGGRSRGNAAKFTPPLLFLISIYSSMLRKPCRTVPCFMIFQGGWRHHHRVKQIALQKQGCTLWCLPGCPDYCQHAPFTEHILTSPPGKSCTVCVSLYILGWLLVGCEQWRHGCDTVTSLGWLCDKMRHAREMVLKGGSSRLYMLPRS